MPLLSKADLQFTYNWRADQGDNPMLRGTPDNDLLDRTEGYEVLYFINKLAADNKYTDKSTGLKIERMIKKHLPGDIRSRVNVIKWLHDNWSEH